MNKVIVSPDEPFPTHHISLDDGETKIGLISVNNKLVNQPNFSRMSVPRTAMKTGTGATKYTDYEPPWSPIAQDNWAGGRGVNDFDKDITRYKDGWRINTLHGEIYLAPQETYATGYRNAISNMIGSVRWVSMISGSRKYLAVQITPTATFDAKGIMLKVRRKGNPEEPLTVELCAQAAGKPATVLQSFTITSANIPDIVSRYWRKEITATTLTQSVSYWIKVYSTESNEANCWQVACKNEAGSTYSSADGSTWSIDTIDLYHRVTDAETTYKSFILFQYNGQQFLLQQPATGAPNLYREGYIGAADSNAGDLNYLIDGTASWTPGELIGAIVEVIDGKGVEELNNWRRITYNSATQIQVSPPWEIPHDNTTVYLVKQTHKFNPILAATHGLTAPVTDVTTINNIAYFSQGDDVAIRRYRGYNNAGAWTEEWAADGTNKAIRITTVRDQTSGMTVWRANNMDGQTPRQKSVSHAPVVDWGTNLTFVAPTDTTFKDDLGKINNIIEYGDTSKTLYIMREGSVFSLSGGKPDELELPEIRTLMDSANGTVVFKNNVYLYWNLRMRLERYYDRNLDDTGANRDDGLPPDRMGIISSAISLPGMFGYTIRGNPGAFSTLMMNNLGGAPGAGYCELYRSPMEGDPIYDSQYQVVRGDMHDGIWLVVGQDVIWLPFIIDKPTNASGWTFTDEGVIELGYMYAGMYDITKMAHAIKLISESLSEDEQMVYIDYRKDQDTTWKTIEDPYTESPSQEQVIDEELGVTGKRIQVRMRIITNNNQVSPKIISIVLEAISRVPIKYGYTITYRTEDNDRDLLGEPEELTAEEKQNILDRWAEELTPLRMRCVRKRFDNKIVFIDPSPMTSTSETTEKYLATLSVTQL